MQKKTLKRSAKTDQKIKESALLQEQLQQWWFFELSNMAG